MIQISVGFYHFQLPIYVALILITFSGVGLFVIFDFCKMIFRWKKEMNWKYAYLRWLGICDSLDEYKRLSK